MAESNDVWQRIEANERIAGEYLKDHEPRFPKYFGPSKYGFALCRSRSRACAKVIAALPCLAREETNTVVYGTSFYSVEVQWARSRSKLPGHELR
jgi:hypothetical protein